MTVLAQWDNSEQSLYFKVSRLAILVPSATLTPLCHVTEHRHKSQGFECRHHVRVGGPRYSAYHISDVVKVK